MSPGSVLGNSKLMEYLEREQYYFTLNPDCDFRPLNVVTVNDEGNLNVLGRVTSFIDNPKGTLPGIQTDEEKPDLSSVIENGADASVEVGTSDLLTKALKFLFQVQLKASYTGIDAVTLTINNVRSDSIYPADLTNFLDGATVTAKNLTAKLCMKGKKCMIIYDTLKSNDISIAFKKNEKTATKNDVKILLNSAGVSGSGNFSLNNDGTVRYKGTRLLTFALKGYGFSLEPSESGGIPSANFGRSERDEVLSGMLYDEDKGVHHTIMYDRSGPGFGGSGKRPKGGLDIDFNNLPIAKEKGQETYSVKINQQVIFSQDLFL